MFLYQYVVFSNFICYLCWLNIRAHWQEVMKFYNIPKEIGLFVQHGEMISVHSFLLWTWMRALRMSWLWLWILNQGLCFVSLRLLWFFLRLAQFALAIVRGLEIKAQHILHKIWLFLFQLKLTCDVRWRRYNNFPL